MTKSIDDHFPSPPVYLNNYAAILVTLFVQLNNYGAIVVTLFLQLNNFENIYCHSLSVQYNTMLFVYRM